MSNSRPRTIRRKALMMTGTSSNSNSKVRGVTVPSISGCVCPRRASAVFRRLVIPFILLHNCRAMTPTQALDELVTANRILAREGVVDSFGHVSIRHPDRPDRYILSRARAPECIEIEDLMEFALDGAAIDAAGRKPYAKRYIHGGVYRARPEVHAVVHH